jgi:hypothetical protein
MNSSRLALIALVVGLILAGRFVRADRNRPAEQPFQTQLLKVAAEYKTWGRVDDEMRWAPYFCRMPNPGLPHISASTDQQTHGQKLYSLFAYARDDYVDLRQSPAVALGQAIVKQSWVPVEVTDPKEKPGKHVEFERVIQTPGLKVPPDRRRRDEADHFYPYVWKGDKVYKASKQADLFVMMKLDPKTPGTDAGWVYATLTPDGKTVTASGKLESCMKCHQDAKHERLFGLYN